MGPERNWVPICASIWDPKMRDWVPAQRGQIGGENLCCPNGWVTQMRA